ncbi:MAG TPA: molybdopterin-dependent oxidoreductase [Acidimicrobiia bacterium]|nr:molybdopterin-dependent oxidoreductase [Acidimicrobiia bacterium]
MASGRRTNLALALLLLGALFAGFLSFAIGSDWRVHPSVVHGVVGLAILVLSPWKSLVIKRGLERPRSGRTWSLMFLFVVLVAIGSGLVHSADVTRSVAGLTLMQIHVGAGLAVLVLGIAHYRRHPQRPRGPDLDRRGFVRLATIGGVASVFWWGWEGLAGASRRFTGSHERGSYDPGGYPVTSWINDVPPTLEADTWRVVVGERDLSLDELAAMVDGDIEATIDCTGGWFSTQKWEGVRLDRLVDLGEWRSVEVASATGYSRRFPIRDLDRLWLAVAVGGEQLSVGHGFPARIVAPDRRGFWWVKWVVSIRPSMTPWWVQSPFPLT